MQLIGTDIHIKYGVFDDAFGHNNALQMVRQCGLHLISKLKQNSELYFPYEGTYSGIGARKKYGDMNIKETPVTNAVNLAFFMVNLSHTLINNVRQHNSEFSVQDIKYRR